MGSLLALLLVLIFVGFGVYAIVTQFQNTKGGSIPVRVAIAIGLSMAGLGGAIVQYFGG